jgi:hypothetical protein
MGQRGFFMDIALSAMQTGIMLGKFALTQALLGVALLGAQQPVTPPQIGDGAGPQTSDTGPANKKLSAEAEKLTAKVLDSYYHPDNLPGLECDVTPDWPAFFLSAKVTAPPDSMKTIEALKIHVRALRDQTPTLVFNWPQGRPADAGQVEASLKQIIGGYYAIYWPLFASPAIRYAAVISKIEPQPDGTTKVYEADPNAYVVMTVDKQGTPTSYTMQSPAMNGLVTPRYAPSPHPVRGDRRRITSVEATQEAGASTTRVQVSVDYQPVGSYFVPRRVSYGLVGAYTMTVEFSGCSVMGAK